MIYLGSSSTPAIKEAMGNGLLGLMTTFRSCYTLDKYPPNTIWGADNGCFSGEWDQTRWWKWLLSRRAHSSSCAFAVAPDVVGDAAATLEKSLPWLPKIIEIGYPPAFVLQDGFRVEEIPWDLLDVLFVGGGTEFKFSEEVRVAFREAKRRGKKTHVGRVNSRHRLRYCHWVLGADSVDGTFLSFGPDVNLPRLLRYLEHTHAVPPLNGEFSAYFSAIDPT